MAGSRAFDAAVRVAGRRRRDSVGGVGGRGSRGRCRTRGSDPRRAQGSVLSRAVPPETSIVWSGIASISPAMDRTLTPRNAVSPGATEEANGGEGGPPQATGSDLSSPAAPLGAQALTAALHAATPKAWHRGAFVAPSRVRGNPDQLDDAPSLTPTSGRRYRVIVLPSPQLAAPWSRVPECGRSQVEFTVANIEGQPPQTLFPLCELMPSPWMTRGMTLVTLAG